MCACVGRTVSSQVTMASLNRAVMYASRRVAIIGMAPRFKMCPKIISLTRSGGVAGRENGLFYLIFNWKTY